jgi:uncharacterized protein YcfJ
MNAHPWKVSFLTASLLMGMNAAQASHPDNDDFLVRARVVSSSPVYGSVNTPSRECWNESSNYETRGYRNNNHGSTIIGAIAGGLLGSTVGRGNGRIAAAAVGAATGAVVGDHWNNGDRSSYPQQVERCRTTDNVRQVVNGYDVRYRFQGREFNTRLPYDPGEWVTLKVNFTVAENQRGGLNRQSRNEWDDNSPNWSNF